MASNRRWTEEDDKILVQTIQENPGNIAEACRKASKKLNRTFHATQQHYYTVISPARNPTKNGILITMVSPVYQYNNRKNSGKALTQPRKSNLWLKIKRFVGLK